MRRWIVAAGALLLPLAVEQAWGAIAIDFESLRQDDAELHGHGATYTEDAFVLTTVGPPGNTAEFRTAGTLDKLSPGSTALFSGQSNAEIILAHTSGAPFDLHSIDLAELPPGRGDPAGPFDSGPFDLTFLGTKAGGSVGSQTFTVDSFLTLKTFTFSGFDDVVTVSWFQGPGINPSSGVGSPTHQFDNIVATPIPEPSAFIIWSLLGTLGIIVRWSRRRRAG